MTVPKPCDPMRLPTSGSSLDMATGNDMEAASMTSSGTNTVVFKSFESLDDLRSVRSPRQAPLLPSDRPLEGEAPQWSAQHSRELYNVNGWGCGYYGITEGGDLTVHPLGGARLAWLGNEGMESWGEGEVSIMREGEQ